MITEKALTVFKQILWELEHGKFNEEESWSTEKQLVEKALEELGDYISKDVVRREISLIEKKVEDMRRQSRKEECEWEKSEDYDGDDSAFHNFRAGLNVALGFMKEGFSFVLEEKGGVIKK